MLARPHSDAPPPAGPLCSGAQFEESLLSASMEAMAGDEDEEEGAGAGGDDGTDFLLKDDGGDLDLRWDS